MSHRHPRFARVVTTALSGLLAATGLAVVAAPAAAFEVPPNDFRISDMGPNGASGFEAQQQDAAYDPVNDRYLVVWRGDEQGDLQAEIHGQLVDARSGAPVGTNDFLVARIGPVGEDDTDAIEPAVAYNSVLGEFLVVFAGDEALDAEPIITDTFEIYAQRVSAAGSLVGTPLRVSDMGADDTNGSFDANDPSVAYNAVDNTFLVAWRGDDDTAPSVNGDVEIRGQMLGYSGGSLVEIGANDVSISQMGGSGVSARDARNGPGVAWNSVNNTFLVAWDGDGLATDNEFEVFGQALTGAGAETGADDFRISFTGSDGDISREVFFDDVAYNSTLNEFLVVWEADVIADNDFEIYGQRLAGATQAPVGGQTRLTTTGTDGATGSPAQFASVAYNPRAEEYYLVWEATGPGLAAGEVEVFGARFTGALGVREAATRLSDVGPAGATGEKPNTPDVVAAGGANNGYLLTWSGPDTPNLGVNESEGFGQLLATSSNLGVTKSASLSSPAPGGVLAYTLTYSNAGPDTAYDVVISDPVPATLTGVSFSTTGSAVARGGAPYVWDVASLASGASATITVTGTVATSAANGAVIGNTATISTTTLSLDVAPANNSGTANVTVDAPPSVTIDQAAGQADPTNASPILFTVTFSEPVTGFAAADVALGGSAGPTTAVVTGGPTAYTVSVSGMTGDGSVTASVPAGAAVDTDGTATANTASTSTDNVVSYDTAVPTLVLSTSAGDPTGTGPIPVTATFSEPVTGFVAGDVTAGNATVGNLAGGPAVYTFDLTPTADGPVTADVAAGAATDAAGNASTAAAQLSVTYDGTAPTVTLTSVLGDPTGTSPIPVVVAFSEPVAGFGAGDITPGNATVEAFAGSGADYTFDLVPAGQGLVTADVAAGVATDAAGNANAAAVTFQRTFDTAAPTATISQAVGQADPTNASPIEFTVTFSEDVTGFFGSDVVLGGAAGATTAVVTGGPTAYTVSVSGMTGDGSVVATVPAGAATDAAGIASAAAAAVNNAVTYDTAVPTLVLSTSAGDPTGTGPIPVTATFSEPVTGFVAGDVTAGNATVGNLAGGPAVYTFDLTPTADGPVTADVAAGAATDAAGNASTAAAQLSVTYDGTAPTPTLSTTATDPTGTSPIPVTVAFDEPVTGFAVGDLAVAGGTAGAFVAVDAATYTAEITPSGDGTVTVDVPAGVATDDAGNGSAAATQLSLGFDASAPSVSLSSATADPFNAGTVAVTVQFSEPVSGFEVGDVAVTGGSVGAFLAVDADTFTLEVTPAAPGAVSVSVPAGVAVDAAGNGSTASATLTRTFDPVPPAVLLSTSAADPTGTAPIPVTATFSEDVTGFEAPDVTVTNGTVSDLAGGPGAFTFSVTPTADGPVTVEVAAGAAQDAAGNPSTAAVTLSITYDGTAPTPTLSSTASDPTNVAPIPVTITFDEPVLGFAVGDVAVAGGTAGAFTVVDAATYTAEVTPGGDGPVTVDVAAAAAEDAAGNPSTAAAQLAVGFDATAPSVDVSSTTPDPFRSGPIALTVTFNEPVDGFEAADLLVTGGAVTSFGPGGPLAALTPAAATGAVFTVEVAPSGPGVVEVSVPAGVATDAAGNGNGAGVVLARTYDPDAPTVRVEQAADQGDPATTLPIRFIVTFSEDVTGFGAQDVTVSGTAGGAGASVAGSDTAFVVTVTSAARAGTVVVSLPAGAASDLAGNPSVASESQDNEVTYAPPVSGGGGGSGGGSGSGGSGSGGSGSGSGSGSGTTVTGSGSGLPDTGVTLRLVPLALGLLVAGMLAIGFARSRTRTDSAD